MKIPNPKPETRRAAADLLSRMNRTNQGVSMADLKRDHGPAAAMGAVVVLRNLDALRTETGKNGRATYKKQIGEAERQTAIQRLFADPRPTDHTAHAKMLAKKRANQKRSPEEEQKAINAARQFFAFLTANGGKIEVWKTEMMLIEDIEDGIDRLLILRLIEPWTKTRRNHNALRFYRIREPQTHSERIRYDNAMIGKID
ncbi:MAG: hypothetical protein JJU07_16200 [Natronohydrobacter sp.]|nr:hypothetical protein [Natronohydrobacter sp.]